MTIKASFSLVLFLSQFPPSLVSPGDVGGRLPSADQRILPFWLRVRLLGPLSYSTILLFASLPKLLIGHTSYRARAANAFQERIWVSSARSGFHLTRPPLLPDFPRLNPFRVN